MIETRAAESSSILAPRLKFRRCSREVAGLREALELRRSWIYMKR